MTNSNMQSRQMNRNRKQRSRRGSALAELGPALSILMLMFFFPFVDCLALGASYASCMVLNYCQLREAAFCAKADAESQSGPVQGGIPEAWQKEGLGQFVNLAAPVKTKVAYVAAGSPVNPGMQDQYVQVTTTIITAPFLLVPIFPGVPGLGAPVTFQIASERLLESSSNPIKS